MSDKPEIVEAQGPTDAAALGIELPEDRDEAIEYLLAKLDSMEEGEGTMLDNTVVLLTSEIARGNSHSHTDSPWLMAGSGGGYFQTGKRLQFDLQPHNNLLVSLMNCMGIEATTFGDPEYCTGPLSGLTA